jgi:hypothetical protein
MAALDTAERPARAGRGGGVVKHTAKWYLALGILGVALVLGLAAGVAAARGGSPAASVPDAAAVSAPGDAATGGAPYRLSPPNETDTENTGAAGLAPERGAPYRVSPPNEQDPAGP